MPDFYCHFCVVLPQLTRQEKEWMEDVAFKVPDENDETWKVDRARAGKEENGVEAWAKEHGFIPRDGLSDPSRISDWDCWPDFEWEFGDRDGAYFSAFSSDHGSYDELNCILLAFLKKWRPNGVITYEVSFTASESHPGADGGCGFVISVERGVEMISTCDWVHAKLLKFQRQGKEQINDTD